ncbi:hypothetical protein A45J_1817 [hot springs metagenome]|uniref:Uncharacterized protein n=1 Tax=hot springs metagenome TaxID=433727 RepID=A0A5J4L7D3_9ZZZZ
MTTKLVKSVQLSKRLNDLDGKEWVKCTRSYLSDDKRG